jgi:uncharacterized protein YqeY
VDAGSSLLPRLQRDQANARREQLKDRVLLLGMIISEVKNREIELRREANDDDVIDVIRKGIKKRRESVELYGKAGRTDLLEAVMAKVMPMFKGRVEGGTINAIVREELARG